MDERRTHGLAAFQAAAPASRPPPAGERDPATPAPGGLPAGEARHVPPWLAGLRAVASEELREGAEGAPEPGGGPRRVAVMIGQLGQGGSERQLYFFLAHCDRTRWAPTLYVSGELGPWEGPIRALGVPVVLLEGSPLAKLRQFRAACRAQRPACFFSWSSYTNGLGLALLGTGVRRIGSFRNAGFADLPERGRLPWTMASLAGISIGVCNSRETSESLRAPWLPRRETVYVENGVELPSPEEVGASRERWRARLELGPDDVLVLGVGRLTAQKNFPRFLDAVAEARKAAPVRAAVAGPDFGVLEGLRARAARLGLEDAVRFLGPVPDARELICAADVFLLTSDHEGMPNVILEAMAAGVPCVATRVNGVPDLVRHGETGFLAGRDAAELGSHVARLALDGALRRRMGERGRALVAGGHDPADVARRLWSLCETPSHGARPS